MKGGDGLDLYQQALLEHARSPLNYQVIDNSSHQAFGKNRLCGDSITIYLRIQNDRIEDCSFSGESCAICKGTASLLTDNLKGRSLNEVESLMEAFNIFVETWDLSDQRLKSFEPLLALKKYPTRLKCLLLPWKTAQSALVGEDKTVTTE